MKYLISIAWIVFAALAYFLHPDNLSWIVFCAIAAFFSLPALTTTVTKTTYVTNNQRGEDE